MPRSGEKKVLICKVVGGSTSFFQRSDEEMAAENGPSTWRRNAEIVVITVGEWGIAMEAEPLSFEQCKKKKLHWFW